MSAYATLNNADWLQLKHHQRPSRFGLGCGARDSDWDYIDAIPSRCGYTFASEDAPVQLLNNYGGMDDDEEMVKDVWTPYQEMATAAEEQIEPVKTVHRDMSGSTSPPDGMDMDMDVDNASATTNGFTPRQFHPVNVATMVSTGNKNKRSFEDLELNTSMAAQCQHQGFQYDSKRIRLGA